MTPKANVALRIPPPDKQSALTSTPVSSTAVVLSGRSTPRMTCISALRTASKPTAWAPGEESPVFSVATGTTFLAGFPGMPVRVRGWKPSLAPQGIVSSAGPQHTHLSYSSLERRCRGSAAAVSAAREPPAGLCRLSRPRQ